jgi:hypothetical protein
VNFSSYAGLITSSDDWYLLNSGLLVTETTLEILNMDIYNYISSGDESVPNFMRIAVANQLAIDGPDWMFWYKEYNTGT